MIAPFWPRKSPHFMALRNAVRPFVDKKYEDYQAGGSAVIHIGLSGGADSLGLLAATCAQVREYEGSLSVHALCIDHGLQENSYAISQQAAQQAEKCGATAQIISIQVGQGNIEAQARIARYQAFKEITDTIWVAHTQEDHVETLLMNLLRAYPHGMEVTSEVEGVKVIRPLLQTRRSHTMGACEELGLSVWNDPYNYDSAFRRVRIRHELIPLLNDILGGDSVGALGGAAEKMMRMNEEIEQRAREAYETARSSQGLVIKKMELLSPAIRLEVIAQWLTAEGIAISGTSISRIDELIMNWHGQGSVAVKSAPLGMSYALGTHKRKVISRIEGVLAVMDEDPLH